MDLLTIIVLFVITSSLKSIFPYMELGVTWQFLLAHAVTSLALSAIFVITSLRCKRSVWFISWYVITTFLLFLNSNYFEFFGKFIQLSSTLVLLPEATVLAKNLAIPLDAKDIIFVVDLPLFLYLLLRHRRKAINLTKSGTIVAGCAAATVVASIYVFAAPVRIDTKMLADAEDSTLVYRYGFIGHNIIDLVKAGSQNGNRVKYGARISSPGRRGKHPNIVLIQIESLDANIINYKYDGKYVAPFLHDLTGKSIYFPFNLCYRKLGGTSDCEIAVNNSVEPLQDFPLIMDESYHYPNSLAKVLRKGGYRAEAFHGSGGWYYKRLSAYASMGYQNFYDPKGMRLPEKGWGVPDQELFEWVENHLDDRKKPFFASIITMTSHEPFNNFRHFVPDKRFDDVEPALTGRYFASIAYTDHAVGEFVTAVKKKFPDTYFFLYGDHTPYVINEGPYRRAVTRDAEKKEMVPLFIITPDGKTRYEHDAVSSYLDVAPTILNAAGIPYTYRSLGVDLVAHNSLRQPISYRGRLRDRTELFKEMVEANRE